MADPDPIGDRTKRATVIRASLAVIAALVVVVGALAALFGVPANGDDPATDPTPTASVTPTATPSETPSPSPTPTPQPLRPTWQTTGTPVVIFSDEFNDATVDTAKWETGWFGTGATDPVNSTNDQCYNTSQVTESGGMLHLKAIQKPATCKGATRPYTSGMVTTRGKFTQHFGSYEARICLPDADGNGLVDNFPAFWVNGMASGFQDGEIDVVEGIGTGRTKATVHYDASHIQAGKYSATPLVGCHNFGAEWRGDNVKFYYDGALLFDTPFVTPTTAQLVLILNHAVDDTHSATVVPADGNDMTVDWVHVFA
jgi:beta-glucanase (GH16 family)